MRLINTSTLKLEEFLGDRIPRYAILSHRWEDEEVLFKDFQDTKINKFDQVTLQTLQNFCDQNGLLKKGWPKVLGCCKQAALNNWEWAWIDTCCIDKTSSAELTEAINSMFTWYERSGVCYAYLSDVPAADENPYKQSSHFRRSEWFTRGWTLQELIAPQAVEFFDRSWFEIGTKRSFGDLIKTITMISHLYTSGTASVAQKMSWASRRKTTRVEDQAYCLMGLFGVNMPLLYGEGDKAFVRLQLEILKNTDDDSIFAWSCGYPGLREAGLLAFSPSWFEKSYNIVPKVFDRERNAPITTSKGIRLELFLSSRHSKATRNKKAMAHIAPINCTRQIEGSPTSETSIALVLVQSCGSWARRPWLGEIVVPSGGFGIDGMQRTLVDIPQIAPLNTWGRFNNSWTIIEYQSLIDSGYQVDDMLTAPLNSHAQIPLEWKSLDAGRRKIKFNHHGGHCFLRISKADLSFAVILYISMGQPNKWLELVEIDLSLREIYNPKKYNAARKVGKDRISRLLEDGNSINISIKDGVIGDGLYRGLYLRVNIEIDPSGKLRWHEAGYEGRKPWGLIN